MADGLEFANSYEAQSTAGNIDIDARVDDKYQSYMDSDNEDFFDGERVDGKDRSDIIKDIRFNVLRRMMQENDASLVSAGKKKDDHDKFTGNLVKDIKSYQKTVLSRNEEANEISQLHGQLASARSPFASMSINLGIKRKNLWLSHLDSKKDKQRAEIIANTDNWKNSLNSYRENVFKKHYSNYDRLALVWYEITREFERQPAAPAGAAGPVGAPPAGSVPAGAGVPPAGAVPAAAVAPAVDRREIPSQAEKKIAEYSAVYNLTFLNALLDHIEAAANIDPGVIALQARKTTDANSANTYDPATNMKYHKKILMEGESDGSGRGTRFKLDRTLHGKMSKRQYSAAAMAVPALVDAVAPMPEAFYRPVAAEQMHLAADEKDINGRYLYSEKNAAIVNATVKRTGQRVHGFFLNGEYVTDEQVSMNEQVADKSGMTYFDSPNFNKQADAEKLRAAIRKSAFFQHVNARTIQYYTSYNLTEDYTEDYQLGGNVPVLDANNYTNTLIQMTIDERPKSLCQYIMTNVANFDPASDVVSRHLQNAYPESFTETEIYLLAQNDPALWDIAHRMVALDKNTAARTRFLMKRYIPEHGELMRTSLLKELIIKSKFKNLIDKNDLQGIGDISQRRAYMEELDNRRGGAGFWLWKNFASGNLRRKLTSFGSSVASGAFSIEKGRKLQDFERQRKAVDDDKDTSQDKKDELKKGINDEEKAFKKKNAKVSGEVSLWTSYANTCTAFSRLAPYGSAAIALGVKFGAHDTAGADIMNSTSSAITLVSDIWKMVDFAIKVHKNRVKTAAAKAQELADLDHTASKNVISCIDSAINCLSDCFSIFSNHVVGEGAEHGALQAVNEVWDKVNGVVKKVLDICHRVLAIIKSSLDIDAARKRIGRIDDTQSDIRSAISAARANDHSDPNKAALGQSAKENSQAMYFMSLTKAESRKSIFTSSMDIVTSSLQIAKDISGLVKTPGALIAKGVFTIAPKISEFISWSVGKLYYDRDNFSNNIATMLGDKKYADTAYFDEVLKRETGIVNKHYLVDIARIFTSIDTHALIQNPRANTGDQALATSVVKTLYGNTDDYNVVKKIKLSDMLRYSGFDKGSDWRGVLKNSLMA